MDEDQLTLSWRAISPGHFCLCLLPLALRLVTGCLCSRNHLSTDERVNGNCAKSSPSLSSRTLNLMLKVSFIWLWLALALAFGFALALGRLMLDTGHRTPDTGHCTFTFKLHDR